jgi:serine/threonine-protein kinase
MPLETIDSLVDALRGRPILRPEQFDELLRNHVPVHADTQELAKTLIRLRWITVYQAKKLIAGKADELVIGPYVVLEKLGEGGMGKVFKAVQLSLNRVVALKVVRGALLRNEIAMKRFRREVKAAADLRHPNIVTVFDADQIGDKHFLAMEYIAGMDLSRLVKDRGPLPVAMACACVRQAALGLQHAHDRKMVHRDIKPSNLLIASDVKGQYTARNVVKILDMGLARINVDEPNTEHLSTELTRAGTVIGTPDFMSPEQAKNSSGVDYRSDLYSLGCTFYYLLTGDVPFPNGNPLEKLLQHQMDAPRPIQLVRMEIPPEVATIVHCLLAKRPNDRFQSGAALAHALDPWCEGIGNSALNPAAVLNAEAVDPSSATIETVPHDPFDFDDETNLATPVTTKGPPPSPRQAVPNRPQRRSWLIGVVAAVAVLLAVGVIGIAVVKAGRKKPEDPPPATQDPPKSDPPKKDAPKGKQDPPIAKDLEILEKYLPNDTAIVLMFDVKQWQSHAVARQVVITPLLEKLAGLKLLTGIDLLAVVERVVIGIAPENAVGDVVIFQGRALVTPKLFESLRNFPGAKRIGEEGQELFVLGVDDDKKMYLGFTETSAILSSDRGRVMEALEKKDGAKSTKFSDPTLARGLEYAYARPFAVYATMGLRSGWAEKQPAAGKLNFIAAGVVFDDRGMHCHTIGDETEPGKAAELQRAFGSALAEQAKKMDEPDPRLERIAKALTEARQPVVAKNRRALLDFFVPTRDVKDWLAPFAPNQAD